VGETTFKTPKETPDRNRAFRMPHDEQVSLHQTCDIEGPVLSRRE